MKQAGTNSRHHTVLTRFLLHNRNSYRTSSILLQTTNHFVTVAPSPFLPSFCVTLAYFAYPHQVLQSKAQQVFPQGKSPAAGEATRDEFAQKLAALDSLRIYAYLSTYNHLARQQSRYEILPLRICRYLTNAIASKRFIRFKRSGLNGTLRERQCSSHRVLSSVSTPRGIQIKRHLAVDFQSKKRALKPS